MIKRYTVTGMTCDGCRLTVENKLKAVSNVTKATVNLENKEAIIEMAVPITVSTFQSVLSVENEIFEKIIPVYTLSVNKLNKSDLQELVPLYIIILAIILASYMLHINNWSLNEYVLDFFGLFFVVFSLFKLIDFDDFPAFFKMYDPLANITLSYAWIYPFIELTLGVFFLFRFQLILTLVLTICVVGITTIGIAKVTLKKFRMNYVCLGTALKLPLTKVSLIENSIILILSIAMLIKLI